MFMALYIACYYSSIPSFNIEIFARMNIYIRFRQNFIAKSLGYDVSNITSANSPDSDFDHVLRFVANHYWM